MLNRILALFAGYLVIRFRGERIERFINLCLQKGIPVWDIYTTRNGTVVGKTSIAGFKCMRPIARRSKVSVRIFRRRGLPFLINKLWKRTAFAAGAMLFILSLYILGSVIWFVQVEGNEQVPAKVIVQAAAEIGLRSGKLRSSLVASELGRALVLKMPELSWAGIELKGSCAIIQVVEKKVVTNDPKPLGHIVASKSGVIKKIVATTGKSAAKLGDTVQQGQLLISGAFQPDEESEVRFVHAEGIVEARVWYESTAESSMRRLVRHRTGNAVTRELLIIGDKEIVIRGPAQMPYRLYEEETQILPIIWRNLGAAVEHRLMTIYEMAEEYEVVSFEQARIEASERALEAAQLLVPVDVPVVDTLYKVELQSDQNTVRVRAVVETTEEIGEFIPLELLPD